MERRSPSLFLAGEASAVIAALRSNVKFNRYADDELEDPLLEEFKALRRKLFAWQNWEDVHPLEYLSPFLETVKSPDTSGPITLVALSSLHKIISRGILGAGSSAYAAEAVQAVADGVTQCKFEATYPASDECVLNKILDVLVAAVSCPTGGLLTNDNLINIFQACYRIGHFQTEKGRDTSELLMQASRQAMAEMVHEIFSRLDVIPEPLDSPFAPAASTVPRLQVSPVPSRAGGTSMDAEGPAAAEGGEAEGSTGASTADQAAAEAVREADQQQTAAAHAAAAGGAEGRAASDGNAAAASEAAAGAAPPSDGAVAAEGALVADAEAVAAAAVSDELPPLQSPTTVLSLLPAVQANPAEQEGYGIEAVREVLLFIISLISSAPVGAHQDLPVHGLDLMNTAVQVALALYVNLGSHMLLQVEALLALLLLPMAEGRAAGPHGAHSATSLELQQVALEGVLDFCTQPGFARDAYLNLDCRIERSNLFEQLCALLSKTAFPVSGPVAAVHLQSVDGILAILTALAGSCNGVADLDPGGLGPLEDPSEFVDIWSALSTGSHPPLGQMLGQPAGAELAPAELARSEKFLKGKLAAAAEHFNRDQKKGFQYLQSLKLLPSSLEPAVVARFLRCCPGLAKGSIGEILGEREEFYERVRWAFMETFDFTGMDFDAALRMFMDSFRPPGEGQKIDRIMQVFGRRYFEQMPSMGLKSADAAYVLAFSVIMLNTDLHNTQNKKKMSLEDFARINRSTNEGEPMPRELLEGIYASIARDELKISSESAADELPSIFWYKLALEARRPRGKMMQGAEASEALERDMFGLVWGPTLAAVSVVLDNASDGGAVRRALDCLLLAARMAAFHQVDEVVDSIVVALSKFGAVLAPPKGVEAYGESGKARAALETMFAIANRYGDWLRSGWRNVMDVVLRLHRLDLLPTAVIAGDGEDPEEARLRWPRPQSISKAKGSSGSLFSRAFTSLISIEGSDAVTAEQAAQREAELGALAAASVEACHVEEIFADSKFLTAESLVELVKAVMWSAGNVAGAARSGEHTAPAELCLELLVALALRNRDRVGLIWPLLHEFLAAATAAENAVNVNSLVERAVLGLLRICQRLLPYKEDTAETLLRSLKLIIGLSPNVAWELAERIALELLALLKSSAPYVRSEADWRTVCAIIKLTSVRPEAASLAYESLSVVCSNPRALSGDSYMPLLETCLQYLERYKQQNVEAAVRFLDLIELLFNWLATQSQRGSQGEGVDEEQTLSDEALVDLWLTTVGVLAKSLCKDECQPLRDTAIMVLSRALVSSERLHLPPELWVQTLRELLVPVATDLAKLAGPKSRSHPGAEKSVRLAVSMLIKTVLQYIEVVQTDKDFYALWQAVLQALQDCMAVRHEAVQESVPENAKNMLLVLASSGILTQSWKDVNGRSLWDLTFSKAHNISSGLNPGMLEATLSPRGRPSPRGSADDTPAGAAAAEASGTSSPPAAAPAEPASADPQHAAPAAEPASAAEHAASMAVGAAQAQAGAAAQQPHAADPQPAVPAVPAQQQGMPAEAPGAAGGQAAAAAVEAPPAVGAADGGSEQAVSVGDEEDEYGERVQAEQSSGTCKQS
ncbi:hypothetical protein ABPG75_003926 [Micractinium tetrahymenae]